MNWGDVPAWGALAVSGIAIWISIKARGDGRVSADAALRSAVAAEETLAAQQRAEAEAAMPRVHLVVSHIDKDLYRLQNDGTATASNIVFDQDDLPPVFRLRGTGEVTLNAGEAIDFLMAGSMGSAVPPQLFARWDGQDPAVPVRVPRKP